MEINDVVIENEDDRKSSLKFGPLAIAEFDDTILLSENQGVEGILSMMKMEGIDRLKKILKVL